jgi:hypothetical protein
VWGRNCEEHLKNLQACLQRCQEKGIVLKLTKSSFCLNRIKWFGRIFTGNGITADPDKLEHIKQAGRPSSTEEVRSLLMACQFNAKFSFDTNPDTTYEDTTAPLRRLLKNDVSFVWGDIEQQAYTQLMLVMNDPATLHPFDPSKPTHIVADSSEYGMQGSLYQEIETNVWVPVDHASRTLTSTEQ